MPYKRARTLRERRRRALLGAALALPSVLVAFVLVGVLEALMDTPPDWLIVGVLVAVPVIVGSIGEYRVGRTSGEE